MKSLVCFVLLLIQATVAAKRAAPLKLPLVHCAANSVQRRIKADLPTGAVEDAVLFNLSIGTPSQSFSVSVETTELVSWVLDARNPNITSGQHAYDYTKSTTAVKHANDRDCYSDTVQPLCRMYYDLVDVTSGNTSVHWNQTIGAAYQYDDSKFALATFPTDGVLGLSWKMDEARSLNESKSNDGWTDPEDSLILNLVANFEQHVFTMWIGARPAPGQSSNNGLLTIGGIDSTHCDSTLNYVPLNLNDDDHGSTIDISGFKVGSFETHRRKSARLDTGCSTLALDTQAYDAVYYAVNPDYSWDDYVLTVDCGQLSSLPDIVFTIAGVDYPIPATSYVLDIGLSNNKCALFVSLSDGNYAVPYVLGLPFLREKCAVWDVDQQRVGFAKGSQH